VIQRPPEASSTTSILNCNHRAFVTFPVLKAANKMGDVQESKIDIKNLSICNSLTYEIKSSSIELGDG